MSVSILSSLGRQDGVAIAFVFIESFRSLLFSGKKDDSPILFEEITVLGILNSFPDGFLP